MDDIDAMSVKEMKSMLDARGVSYVDCFEKSDLRNKVRETLMSPPVPIIRTLKVGPLRCNMTIIADPVTKEALLVDPGGNPEAIIALLNELGVTVSKILVTHGHFDHFLAANDIHKYTSAPVCIHSADKKLYEMLPIQLQMFGQSSNSTLKPIDLELSDGMELGVLGGVVIHTPGHSPGSCCFHFPDIQLLCSGDTLFKGSIGRTDLWFGDSAAIKQSIQNRLYTLPDETRVIPGHESETTIGAERRTNMVVRDKCCM